MLLLLKKGDIEKKSSFQIQNDVGNELQCETI